MGHDPKDGDEGCSKGRPGLSGVASAAVRPANKEPSRRDDMLTRAVHTVM